MRLLHAALAAMLALPALAQDSPDPAEIRAAIGDLGSEEYEVREKATERLAGFGVAALGALEEAGGSEDAEVRRRARILVQRIRLASINREGIWESLVATGDWHDNRWFAGATVRFYRDESGDFAAWRTVHGSGRPVLHEDECRVELDGLVVTIDAHAFTFDRDAGVLLDQECVAYRLVPSGRDLNPGDPSSERPGERRDAMWAAIHDQSPPDPIFRLLSDPDPEVRSHAAYAAGWRRLTGARERLREILADSDPRVRREAAEALGRTGEPADRERLEELFEDPDPTVQAHARQAVETLSR